MDPRVRELTILGGLACICLVLAWWYDERMFATLFAVEAAWAGVEAVYLSQ
jgi:hypothetical protein